MSKDLPIFVEELPSFCGRPVSLTENLWESLRENQQFSISRILTFYGKRELHCFVFANNMLFSTSLRKNQAFFSEFQVFS